MTTSKLLAEQQASGSGAQVKTESGRVPVPSGTDRPAGPKPAPHIVDRNFILGQHVSSGSHDRQCGSTRVQDLAWKRPRRFAERATPSRALQYGMALPITGATVAWSYYIKKKIPELSQVAADSNDCGRVSSERGRLQVRIGEVTPPLASLTGSGAFGYRTEKILAGSTGLANLNSWRAPLARSSLAKNFGRERLDRCAFVPRIHG
jgi:hypothetical protein